MIARDLVDGVATLVPDLVPSALFAIVSQTRLKDGESLPVVYNKQVEKSFPPFAF